MDSALRIAIIGDYNFAYNSHNATNLALQHVENFLDQRINSYWLNEKECCEKITGFMADYDGFFLAPGPYRQPFYVTSILKSLRDAKVPVIGTGECFKLLIENFFTSRGLDLQRERIMSENLVAGNQFTEIKLDRFSSEFEKLYMSRGNVEYSSSRFSVLPQYSDMLAEEFEICARNQYFDPEILKAKSHPFFLFTMFCPQIISTQDIPHPLMIYFVKTVKRLVEIRDI